MPLETERRKQTRFCSFLFWRFWGEFLEEDRRTKFSFEKRPKEKTHQKQNSAHPHTFS